VRLINVKNDYNAAYGFYAGDIAVVVLATDVKINDIVTPICVDWNKTYTDYIPDGSLGKVNLFTETQSIIEPIHKHNCILSSAKIKKLLFVKPFLK